MDGQPNWTDCDEAGDDVVPNVLSPRDLVSRPRDFFCNFGKGPLGLSDREN